MTNIIQIRSTARLSHVLAIGQSIVKWYSLVSHLQYNNKGTNTVLPLNKKSSSQATYPLLIVNHKDFDLESK